MLIFIILGAEKLDHDIKSKALLKAAKREGLTSNKNKCIFYQKEISLVGYRVNSEIRSDSESLRSLLEMASPQIKTELQRALGMFSYYAEWIQKFLRKVRPLIPTNLFSSFPLSPDASQNFITLCRGVAAACVTCI